jgi:tetratricopeptide (TPR) repeat protein
MARFRAAKNSIYRLLSTHRISLLIIIAVFAACTQFASAGNQNISAAALATRGDERAARSDIKGAVEDYSDAIKKNHRCVEAYFGRGLLRARFGQANAAIEDYSKVIRLKPQMREAFLARGMTHEGKGDYAKAIMDFTRAIDLAKNE